MAKKAAPKKVELAAMEKANKKLEKEVQKAIEEARSSRKALRKVIDDALRTSLSLIKLQICEETVRTWSWTLRVMIPKVGGVWMAEEHKEPKPKKALTIAATAIGVLVAGAVLFIVLRELRIRYRFNQRTPYGFHSNADSETHSDFAEGLGLDEPPACGPGPGH